MLRLCRSLVALVIAACALVAAAEPIPSAARAYQHELHRLAYQEFGLDAPVALFAAQVHQESSWRSNARSPYADGLTQFTPATADWIAQIYPDLGEAAPFSPGWAMRAMLRYDRHIHARIHRWAGDEAAPAVAGELPACERWAMTLSGYNGGPGWVSRDRRLAAAQGADPDLWWGHVERHTARAQWAAAENRGYPRRILLDLEPHYRDAGFRGPATC